MILAYCTCQMSAWQPYIGEVIAHSNTMGKKKNRKNKASKSTPAVAAATEASAVETAGVANTTEKVEDEVAPASASVPDIGIENSKNTSAEAGGDDASQYDTAQEEDDEEEDATTNTDPAVVETGTACDDDANQDQNGDVAEEESTKKEEEVVPTETTRVAVEAETQDEKGVGAVSEEEYVSDLLSCHDDNDVADEKESESETDEDDNPWAGTTPEGDIMLEEADHAEEAEKEEVIAPDYSRDEVKAGGIGTTEGAHNSEDGVNTENGPAPPAGESTSEVAKKDKSPLMGESTSSHDSHNIGDISVGANKEKTDTTTQNIEATLGPLLPGESEGDEWVVVDTADSSSGKRKEEEEAKTTTLDKEDETNEAVVDDGGEATQANPFKKLVKKIVARTCCLKSARNMA